MGVALGGLFPGRVHADFPLVTVLGADELVMVETADTLLWYAGCR